MEQVNSKRNIVLFLQTKSTVLRPRLAQQTSVDRSKIRKVVVNVLMHNQPWLSMRSGTSVQCKGPALWTRRSSRCNHKTSMTNDAGVESLFDIIELECRPWTNRNWFQGTTRPKITVIHRSKTICGWKSPSSPSTSVLKSSCHFLLSICKHLEGWISGCFPIRSQV